MMSKRPPTVIIAAKAGRLGNRLFLSAYFMANALAKGYELLNPALAEYMPLFEGSAFDPLCRFPNPRQVGDADFSQQCAEVLLGSSSIAGGLVGEGNLLGIRQLDIRLSHDAEDLSYDLCSAEFKHLLEENRYLIVKGWKFRDDQNLVRFHAQIREYFRPVSSVRRPAELAVASARGSADVVIGVHVRQGDYRHWKNGVHYFETEQYAHWMREAQELFPGKKISYLVCASDPIDKSCFSGLSVVAGPGYVASDLYALSLCDAIIGPPSTFSTWASYYGRVPFCMLQHAGQRIYQHDFVLHDRV